MGRDDDMTPPDLDEDRQLADLLVELALLTREQLAQVASSLPRDRTPPLLARDLFERGLLSPARFLDALEGHTVSLRCVPCGRIDTAAEWSPDRAVACPGCGVPMRLPGIPPALLRPPSAVTQPRLPSVALHSRDTQGARTLHHPTHQEVTPAPFPGTAFGRYRLLERLGEGGMGVVWKALDTELGRVIALKQIRGDGAEGNSDTVSRFQREARLAAALRHPGIVAVHDVGEIDGKPYITMDWVQGRTLEEFLEETRAARRAGARPDPERLRREVAILAAVADAVAHAHEHGVIHRDLKHGNVLLDRADRPYVMDFGLAREVDVSEEPVAPSSVRRARTLTMDGQSVGTPMFMSPEQARGLRGEVGVRSDIWSLGVMLYDILTGETPFERAGTPWEIMLAVVKSDPVPPRRRNPHAPRELEAVALKALEKEPERRYRSASELTEELRRWLRGDPVEARHPGLLYRLWRRLARNPKSVGAAAIAAALLLAFAGMAWRERAEGQARAREAADARRAADQAGAREHAKQAALIAQLRNVSGLALTAVLELRRRGIVGREARFAVALERAFEDVRNQAPDLAEPWFHRGRLLRALRKTPEALVAQDEALARNPDFAPALYERAVLCLQLHQARTTDAYLAAMAAVGERRRAAGQTLEATDLTLPEVEAEDAELRRWKENARASLAQLQAELARDPSWATQAEELLRVDAARTECIAGMLGLCGESPLPEARTRLERAVELDPALEEAYDALYSVSYVEVRWDLAEQACTRGLDHDLGWLPFWERRGEARLNLAAQPTRMPEERDRIYAGALADLDRALEIEPGRVESLRLRGGVRAQWAQNRSAPAPELEAMCRAAVADFDAAIARAPDLAGVLAWRGNARVALAQIRRAQGQDAAAEIAAALADFDRAIELAPGLFDAWSQRGRARCVAAESLPPGPRAQALADAESDLERAVALHSGNAGSWSTRGTVRLQLAELRAAAGEDPSAAWSGAIADFQQSLRLQPGGVDAWLRLGNTCEAFAIWRALHAQDYAKMLEQAVASYKNAMHLAPASPQPHIQLGGFWLNWGNCLAERTRDADGANAAFLRAIQVFGKATELAPTLGDAWYGRALAHRNRGWLLGRTGGDSEDDYLAAEADAQRAAKCGADPEAVRKLLEQVRERK